jgi:hypothetical protein
MTSSFTAEERETIIQASDAGEAWLIWTAQRKVMTLFRRRTPECEVRSGAHGTSEWAEFLVPDTRWSPLGFKRTVTISEEERERRSQRLRESREGAK